MATSNGSSGDDTINGTTGADNLNGGAGADYLYGDAGSDRLNGGSGTDTLDGGSGSDTLNGDSGNDTLVYTLAQNAGAGDLYTGGSGIDTVRLMLTNAEWLNDGVQLELARYFAHLATVQTNNQGEVSNGSSRDFTFNFSSYFGSSTTLTVQMMEKLQVYVDGVVVIDLDKPIIDVVDSTVTGTVVEDGADDGDGTTFETASGSIKFFDLDASDTHTVSVTPPAGAIGSLTATITNVATGDGQGTVGWTYTLNDAAAQSLSAGETRTEVYVVKITDDDGQCVTQNVTITITGTNDAPVAVADSNAGLEDTTITGTVASNDSDVDDGAVLSYSLNAPVAGLTLNGDGSYSFDASNAAYQHLAQGATADVVANYTVTDQHGASSTSTLTITLTGTNDAPVAVADSNAGLEDTTITGTVASNDSDVDDGAVLSYSLNAPVAGLTLNGDGSYSFDASNAAYQHLAQGATADVVANYTVTDQHGASSTSTLTITLTGTNDAPVAVADSNAGLEDTTITGTVASNDSDVDDGAVLSYSLNAPVAGLTLNGDGSYSFDASNAAYQHLAQGATADVVANYTVTDQHGASSTSTLTITLTGTNDAPVAVADSNAGLEDTTITGTVASNDSDVDDGAVLSYSLNAPVAGLTLNGDGSYSFDASNAAYQHLAQGATADVVANYTVTDQHGASSTSTLTITLTGTNDAPVAVADSNAGLEDTTITGTVASNDSDVDDGAVLSYSLNAPVAGLTLNGDGSYSFDASNAAYQHLAQGATADVVANYTVTDQHGASSTSTLTITLTGTNDAPVAVADSNAGLEDTTITGTVASNDSDVDDGAVLSYSLNAPVAGLTLNGDGSYSFDASNAAYQHLAQGATADVVANYTVTDQHGASSTSTLTITLTGTNDAPVAVADSNAGLEDTTITGTVASNDSDVDDGAVLSYSLNAPVAGLTLNGDGSYSFDASNAAYQHLAQGATADVVANYTVTDQHGASSTSTLTITLTGTNDAPVLNAAATPALNSVAEDSGAPVGAMGTLVSSLANLNPPVGGLDNVTDADAGAVTGIALTGTNNSDGTWYYSINNGGSWTAVGSVSNGQALLLAADSNTRLYFQANANFNGSVTGAVTFRAWDQTTGTAGTKVDTAVNGGSTAYSSATDTANITVSALNDNPVATNDVLWVSNSTNVTLSLNTLLGNDVDVDGLALSVTSFTAGAGISAMTVNADGTFSFTTDGTGGTVASPTARTFTYAVSDGAGGTTTGSVTVNVVNFAAGNTAETVSLAGVGNYNASYIDARGGNDNVTDGSFQSVLIGGTQNDTLNGSDGNDILRGGTNNDVLNGGNGTDLLDFSDAADGFTLSFVAGSGTVTNAVTSMGADDYTSMEGVIGSNSAATGDTLSGSAVAATNDVFWGMAGNDTLNGNLGNDTLRGGVGNDTIDGGAGTDLLDFSDATGALNFTLVQSASNTTVSVGATPGLGQDAYRNMEGVIGSTFGDTLIGSVSGDVIIGGAGADQLTGGTGSDTFGYRSGDAPAVDTITDFNSAAPGSGGDVLDISDLLIGAPTLNTGNVGQYLDIRENGSGGSIISIDRDGTGSTYGFQDFAVLTGVTGLNLNTLLTNGNIDYSP